MTRHRSLLPSGAFVASILLLAPASPAQPPPEAPPPAPSAPAPPPPAPPPAYAPGPEVMDWNEGQEIPPGYRKERQIRKELVAGGAGTFGGIYLLNVIIGGVALFIDRATCDTSSCPSAWPAAGLFIPVAGPFTFLGRSDVGPGMKGLLAIDGLFQAGGVALFVAGLTAKRTVLVRDDVREKTWTRVRATWAPAPLSLGSRGAGVGIAGTW